MKNNKYTTVFHFFIILYFMTLSCFSNSIAHEKEIEFKLLKIAIIDTHFCSKKFSTSSPIQIQPIEWMSESPWPQECTTSRMDHGQQVLDYFIKEIEEKVLWTKKIKIQISPLVVFEKNGTQTLLAWNKAMNYIESNSIDFALSSVGFLSQKKVNFVLPKKTFYFLAAPRNEGLIRQTKYVYPQILVPNPQSLLIAEKIFNGHQWILDPLSLYSKYIDIQMEESTDPNLKGSSFAAPKSLAQFIIHCYEAKIKWTTKKIKQCINKLN